MKRFNRSQIFAAAWKFFRQGVESFAAALRMAWANAKRAIEAKSTAGISEETHTWAGWKALGFEVIHESKALFIEKIKKASFNGFTHSGRSMCWYLLAYLHCSIPCRCIGYRACSKLI